MVTVANSKERVDLELKVPELWPERKISALLFFAPVECIVKKTNVKCDFIFCVSLARAAEGKLAA